MAQFEIVDLPSYNMVDLSSSFFVTVFFNTPGMMRGWWGWAAKIVCFEAELGREIVEEMGRNRQVLIMILMDFNHLGVK